MNQDFLVKGSRLCDRDFIITKSRFAMTDI